MIHERCAFLHTPRIDPLLYLESTFPEHFVNLIHDFFGFFHCVYAVRYVIHVAIREDGFTGTWTFIFAHLGRFAKSYHCDSTGWPVPHIHGGHDVCVGLPFFIQVPPKEAVGHLVD